MATVTPPDWWGILLKDNPASNIDNTPKIMWGFKCPIWPILKTDLPPNNSEDVNPKPTPNSTPPCLDIHSLVFVKSKPFENTVVTALDLCASFWIFSKTYSE